MIRETASGVLFESIRWLYLVQSFKELNDYDQLILIEQSWALLFLLTSAEMKKFLETRDEMDSFDEDNQYPLFQLMVKELTTHSIDSTEYALLKLFMIYTIRKLSNWICCQLN